MKIKNIFGNKILLIFIIIFIVATMMRFYALDSSTLVFDEVALYTSAEEYTRGNFFHNFYAFDTPPFTKYLVAVSLVVFDFSEIWIRIYSAVFGSLIVILTFLFAQKFYEDKRIALLASGITAFSILHLAFSRLAEHLIPVGFFYLSALYLFFDFIDRNNKTRKSYVFLGIAVALGLMTKFLMLYLIATIIIYAIIKKRITLKIKPNFSLIIDNYILKAAIVFIVVFLVLWPFFLYPLNVDFNVVIEDKFQRNFSLSIPEGLMAFGEVSKSAVADQRPNTITNIPFLGYFTLFAVKESILFTILFFIGLYFITKKPTPTDKFLATTLILFFLFLWMQNWGYTYRYISVIIPFLAIISSRWIVKIKKENISYLIIILITFVFFLNAMLVQPHYVLYYNELNSITNITGLEDHFSEGLKESMNYIKSNCQQVFTDRANVYMALPYFNDGFFTQNSTIPETDFCVLVGMATNRSKDADLINKILNEKNCKTEKQVEVYGTHVYEIHKCRPTGGI